jgi:two-component system, cell cycle sensor histidine kinase and response regulator CckA
MNSAHIEHKSYCILVMDDEKMIRDLAASMLKFLGYNAITCSNGEEAIALYKIAHESGSPFLTVVMDLTIFGGMGGKDAAQQILLINPSAKLIVSSGYSDDPVMADHKGYGFQALLPKPYTISDIARVLNSLSLPPMPDYLYTDDL